MEGVALGNGNGADEEGLCRGKGRAATGCRQGQVTCTTWRSASGRGWEAAVCPASLKGIRASNGCTVKMVRVVGEGVKVLPGIRGFILNVMNELVNFVIGLKF